MAEGRKAPGTRAAGVVAARAAKTAADVRRRAIFLDVLRSTANVSRAARAAGLPTSSLYRRRARSQAFAAEWDAAINEAIDSVEEELIRRARDGVERPVFYGGRQIGTMQVHSNDLLMFLARARRPEIYDRAAAAARAGGSPQAAQDMSEAEAGAEITRRIERMRGK